MPGFATVVVVVEPFGPVTVIVELPEVIMKGLLPVEFMMRPPTPHRLTRTLIDPKTIAIIAITVTDVGRSLAGGKKFA
jgi:hypothetical protein